MRDTALLSFWFICENSFSGTDKTTCCVMDNQFTVAEHANGGLLTRSVQSAASAPCRQKKITIRHWTLYVLSFTFGGEMDCKTTDVPYHGKNTHIYIQPATKGTRTSIDARIHA